MKEEATLEHAGPLQLQVCKACSVHHDCFSSFFLRRKVREAITLSILSSAPPLPSPPLIPPHCYLPRWFCSQPTNHNHAPPPSLPPFSLRAAAVVLCSRLLLAEQGKAMAARDAQTSSGENNRVKYAVAWLKGSQVPMQDAHTAMLDLDGSNSRSFFGVFDGHGGDTVALYCSEQFHAELIQDPDYKTNLQTAMLRMYFRADEKLKASDKWRKPPSSKGKLQRCMDSDLCGVCQLWKKPYTGPQEEGSTACVAIIEGNRILVANAGDSRCVLSRNGEAIDLSTDHKPNVEDEKKRIQAAGGQVLKNEMSKIKLGEFAELGIPRVDGKLLISRSIGIYLFIFLSFGYTIFIV
uniref:Uncharacterized protein n=1 Tax=Avena sativa TaxID=4498 RepID=A0ACD5UI80_AVESA